MSLRIHSLSTTAGFLRDAPIEFAPGVTCIIGARGTCKSTLVETIRFAFDCDPARVAELVAEVPAVPLPSGPSSRGLIRATLQSGLAKCSAVQQTAAGPQTVTVEREVGSPPRLYREGIQELADKSLLNCVEIYSQGDLQRIAEDERLRLDLIDRPYKHEIDALLATRAQIAAELKQLGPRIRAKSADVEARRADIRALDQLRSQLSQVQSERPQLSTELDEERDAATRRESMVDGAARWAEARTMLLASLSGVLGEADLPPLAKDLHSLDEAAAATLTQEASRLSALLTGIRGHLNRTDIEIDPAIGALRTACDRRNARYYALRQQQQDVNEILKREDALKQQIAHLEKLQTELLRFEADLRQLKDQRDALRRRLQEIADRVFARRQAEVDRINQRYYATIVLTLEQGSRSRDYASRLIALLQGSRIRGQDDVARELASRIPPSELIDIVEASDISRLVTVLGRDAGQMTRLVAYLVDRPELYDLEAVVFEDHLEITMYDHDVPKPITQLSKGQMATALLPLILRSAPYPLVFDQPEDDLDNSFIYETLVSQIKELKASRQLIFVTHNANIPVLGEADVVVVMEMETPHSARTPSHGSVDDMKEHILRLLEGGVEAFRCRQNRYRPLL